MIKLFATDMDGTFLRDDMSYDEARFAQLYQKMQAAGSRFVVASGNQYFQLKSFFQAYPDVIYVAENGAYIRDTKQIYALHSFEQPQVKQILTVLSQIPELKFLVCGQKSAYALTSADPAYIENARHYYHQLALVTDFTQIDDYVLKFALSCPQAQTDTLVASLRQLLANVAEPTSSGHGDIDIIQLGMNKAAGLAELGKILEIELAEMCAFGDGGNDLEMLREVGLGVAMANAQPAVKAVTTLRTSNNQEQGVLAYLAKLI